MVPSKTHPKWEALLEGRLNFKFGHAHPAALMLHCRLPNNPERAPSPFARPRVVDELHAFFAKYQRALEAEIKAVFG